MFERITPEQAGVSSERVYEYLTSLKRRHLPMHDLLIMKGDKVFAEFYWAPFHKDFNHRLYSQTKSYVAIAIGLLVEDGLVDLDRPAWEYFPDKIEIEMHENLKAQTVRDMLMMATVGEAANWFKSTDPDRVHLYFNSKKSENLRPSGTVWGYDSAGSQVLSTIVERLTGKSLFDFLYERIFSHLGTFKNATILKTRNSDSWGDSAMVCTARDDASFARLLMQGGKWEGKQLISEAFVKEATSKLIDNRELALYDAFHTGYGYQIWRCEGKGFAFLGMGNQLTVCLPEKDIVFVCNADSQGVADVHRALIVGNFLDMVERFMQDSPLPENKEAYDKLMREGEDLELFAVQGNPDSPLREQINGRVYDCPKNDMGITEFSFRFENEREGELVYVNAQGEKHLPFSVNANRFGKFPQLGYSDGYGGARTEGGFTYDDAVSLAWMDDNRIMIYVQIIDRYFGNCTMIFGFKGDYCTLVMRKTAEDFLEEYQGATVAKRRK